MISGKRVWIKSETKPDANTNAAATAKANVARREQAAREAATKEAQEAAAKATRAQEAEEANAAAATATAAAATVALVVAPAALDSCAVRQAFVPTGTGACFWTVADDRRLAGVIAKHGTGSWASLAASFNDATDKDAQERSERAMEARWRRIRHRKATSSASFDDSETAAVEKEEQQQEEHTVKRWTEVEDLRLGRLVRAQGVGMWDKKAAAFVNRTSGAIKNRWQYNKVQIEALLTRRDALVRRAVASRGGAARASVSRWRPSRTETKNVASRTEPTNDALPAAKESVPPTQPDSAAVPDRWSDSEDRKLGRLLLSQGPGLWVAKAQQHFPNRTAQAVKFRW